MNSLVASEWIVKATRNYIARQQDSQPEIAAAVQAIDALPLYCNWGGGVAIRADGELIGFLWDEPQSVKVETDPHLRFLALVVGVELYPELQHCRRSGQIAIGIAHCATEPVRLVLSKNTASIPRLFGVTVGARDGYHLM